jgi:uncharacterized membrane protein
MPQERAALRYVGGVGMLFALLSVPFLGPNGALQVLFGVAISVANLWLITRTVRALLVGQFQLSLGAMAVLKLLVLLFVLYALFSAGWISGLPLIIGFGSLPIGIVMAQLAPPKPSNEETSRA